MLMQMQMPDIDSLERIASRQGLATALHIIALAHNTFITPLMHGIVEKLQPNWYMDWVIRHFVDAVD